MVLSENLTKKNSLCSGGGTHRRISWIDCDWCTEAVLKDRGVDLSFNNSLGNFATSILK